MLIGTVECAKIVPISRSVLCSLFLADLRASALLCRRTSIVAVAVQERPPPRRVGASADIYLGHLHLRLVRIERVIGVARGQRHLQGKDPASRNPFDAGLPEEGRTRFV